MISTLYHAAFLSMTLYLCKAGFSEVAVIKSKYYTEVSVEQRWWCPV